MRIPNPFRRSTVRDLETLSKELQVIKRKTDVAVKWRRRILERISEVIEILRQNPGDKDTRKRLVKALDRERQFLDMVRNGTKNTISILEVTLKELKKAQIDSQIKNQLLQTVQYLIDAMQFAKGKIKVIEKRIKKGGPIHCCPIKVFWNVRQFGQFSTTLS